MDTMLGTSSNSHFLWDFWVFLALKWVFTLLLDSLMVTIDIEIEYILVTAQSSLSLFPLYV
jgi:hypothetical protein